MKKFITSLLITVTALFAAPTMAPDFNATTTTGKEISLKQYMSDGKPLIVYFTASWCPICATNWPSLNEIYKTYGDKVNLVAISIDPSDTNEVLLKQAKDKNLEYPMVAGNPGIMIHFGVKGQATTVVVNPKGEIVYKKTGHISLADYKKLVEDTLANE